MHQVAKFIQKIVWLANYIFLKIFFFFTYSFHISVDNELLSLKGPIIIAPNHQSVFDPWVVVVAMPFAVFRKLLPIRYVGTTYYNSSTLNFLERIGIIPLVHYVYGVIRMERGKTKHEKLVPFRDALREGDTVGIFVEGALSEPGVLGPIKDGVALLQLETGVSVLPIAIHYGTRKFFRRSCVISYGAPIKADRSLGVDETKDRIEMHLRKLFESHTK